MGLIIERFWRGKRVFVTGHTGFKGSWLCILLNKLGAEVTGYSLAPSTTPSMYELCNIDKRINSIIGDVRDSEQLTSELKRANPEIVFHLAAQSLVRESYKSPRLTYETNVMGTVNLLEAVRNCRLVRAVVNVTTDKCYENKEWYWGYRETDKLGGYDPYSNSKACSELVTNSYRTSYFNPSLYSHHGVAIATARAGNVIGGGDWAEDRLIPDCIRSLLLKEPIFIRNPHSIRPWQYVLEPLNGYLILAQKLLAEGSKYGEAWNFGPEEQNALSVLEVVDELCRLWGGAAEYTFDQGIHPHESRHLKLDCSRAKFELDWKPLYSVPEALSEIVNWVEAYRKQQNMWDFSTFQIERFVQEKR